MVMLTAWISAATFTSIGKIFVARNFMTLVNLHSVSSIFLSVISTSVRRSTARMLRAARLFIPPDKTAGCLTEIVLKTYRAECLGEYRKFFRSYEGHSAVPRPTIRSALNCHGVLHLGEREGHRECSLGMAFAYPRQPPSVSIYRLEMARATCSMRCLAARADYTVKEAEREDKWEGGKKATCHLLVRLKTDRVQSTRRNKLVSPPSMRLLGIDRKKERHGTRVAGMGKKKRGKY